MILHMQYVILKWSNLSLRIIGGTWVSDLVRGKCRTHTQIKELSWENISPIVDKGALVGFQVDLGNRINNNNKTML